MRRHVDPETPPDEDTQAIELRHVLKVLLPIRKQRLSRSERQQRQQEKQLQQCQQDCLNGEQTLQQQRQHYLETVAAFAPQHQGKKQPMNLLRGALDNEQSERDGVLRQQQQLITLDAAALAQQARVNEAQQTVKCCQRDVEKIEYLLTQNEGTSS